MKILPRNDFVLVEFLTPASKSAGGVLLPDSAKDKKLFKPAKVLALGAFVNAPREKDASIVDHKNNQLKVGSIVLVNSMASVGVDPQNDDIKMIRQDDVVANVE
jgi:co-chaperonin GroES (HSP10)